MSVQLLCPNLRCRKFLSVPDDVRGKLMNCKHCNQAFRVPAAKAMAAAAAPAQPKPAPADQEAKAADAKH